MRVFIYFFKISKYSLQNFNIKTKYNIKKNVGFNCLMNNFY